MAEKGDVITLTTNWQKVSHNTWSWCAIQNQSIVPVFWCRSDGLPAADFDGAYNLAPGELVNVTGLSGVAIYARTRTVWDAKLVFDGGE